MTIFSSITSKYLFYSVRGDTVRPELVEGYIHGSTSSPRMENRIMRKVY